MDVVHEEFAQFLCIARTTPDEQLLPLLQEIGEHCRMHFALEEQWMAQAGFPGGECHAQEHAAVLASIAGVIRRVGAGEWHVGRTLVRSLQDWFPAHAQHLDSALAHWMSEHRWGGKPFVFHRRAGKPASVGSPLR